jgi:hypothetical protein
MHPGIMTKFLLLFLLSAQIAFAQTKTKNRTKNTIAAIDIQVKRINNLNLEEFKFTLQLKQPNSDISKFLRVDSTVVYSAYYKNDSLKKIVVHYPSLLSQPLSSLTTYYFQKEQLICIAEKAINASRMGSCGEIEITNLSYFKNNMLVGSKKITKPSGPFYSSCYPPDISESHAWEQLPEILKTLETNSNNSHRKAVVERFRLWNSTRYQQRFQALSMVKKELKKTHAQENYLHEYGLVFIEPVLWERYKKIDALKEIERDESYAYDTGTLHIERVHGHKDFQLLWTQIKKEIGENYKVTIASAAEIKQYIFKVNFYIDTYSIIIMLRSSKHVFLLKFIGPKETAELSLHSIEELKVEN